MLHRYLFATKIGFTTILTKVDPTAPVDPGEFLQTLPPSLRQSLLADMEESQISALPAELAAEAQNLRRDYEQVNVKREITLGLQGECLQPISHFHLQRNSRQMMHERFFNHVNHSGGPTLSSILRSTVSRLNLSSSYISQMSKAPKRMKFELR